MVQTYKAKSVDQDSQSDIGVKRLCITSKCASWGDKFFFCFFFLEAASNLSGGIQLIITSGRLAELLIESIQIRKQISVIKFSFPHYNFIMDFKNTNSKTPPK